MRVLLVVDVQNDFCPGGALGVKGGDQIIPLINQFRNQFERVIFTQDWHPPDHLSFAANHPGKQPGDTVDIAGEPQMLWPVHCVQGSVGAQFHKDLDIRPQDSIFKKGTHLGIDSYSAFYDDHHLKSTGLAEFLHKLGVRDVTLCGLATDYCVKYSCFDALAEDFCVTLLPEACRAVNLHPGDEERSLEEMRQRGSRLAVVTQ
jgi:nicotinamidase/pyrazinamidase